MGGFQKEINENLLITLYKMSIIELKNAQVMELRRQNPHASEDKYPLENQLTFSLRERALLKLLYGEIPEIGVDNIYPIYLDLYKKLILNSITSPTIGPITTSYMPFIVSDIAQIGFRNQNGGKIFLLTNLGSTFLSTDSTIYKSLSKDMLNKLLLDMWVSFSKTTGQPQVTSVEHQSTNLRTNTITPVETQVPYGTPFLYEEMLKAGQFPVYKFENILGYVVALYLFGSAIATDDLPDFLKEFAEETKIEPRNMKLLMELGQILETTSYASSAVIGKTDDISNAMYNSNYFGDPDKSYTYVETVRKNFNLNGEDFCLLFTYKDKPSEYVFNVSKKTEDLLDRCFGNKINQKETDLVILVSKGLLTQINP